MRFQSRVEKILGVDKKDLKYVGGFDSGQSSVNNLVARRWVYLSLPWKVHVRIRLWHQLRWSLNCYNFRAEPAFPLSLLRRLIWREVRVGKSEAEGQLKREMQKNITRQRWNAITEIQTRLAAFVWPCEHPWLLWGRSIGKLLIRSEDGSAIFTGIWIRKAVFTEDQNQRGWGQLKQCI